MLGLHAIKHEIRTLNRLSLARRLQHSIGAQSGRVPQCFRYVGDYVVSPCFTGRHLTAAVVQYQGWCGVMNRWNYLRLEASICSSMYIASHVRSDQTLARCIDDCTSCHSYGECSAPSALICLQDERVSMDSATE